MKPFVKWAGGKGQILGELLARVPERYGGYYEPFVGGGALFFALNPERAVLNDRNEELINAYSVIRSKVSDLAGALAAHASQHRLHGRDYYYRVRDLNPDTLSDVERASRFIYLNKTCYNGLWRVNNEGRFNVPFGRHKNPRILDEENLRAVSDSLRHVTLLCTDFESSLGAAQPGDFVYFDPPYHPLSETSYFTKYVDNGFGPEDQIRLAAVFRSLAGRGVNVMLSNSDTKFVQNLYPRDEFEVEIIQAKRPISCRAEGRGVVNELVIRNYS
ncbi:MAG: DNA adenine methylase [Ignavibacteriales bacterium]